MTYRGDGVERPQSRMAWEMNPPEDSTQKKVPGQESNFRWTKFLVDELTVCNPCLRFGIEGLSA